MIEEQYLEFLNEEPSRNPILSCKRINLKQSPFLILDSPLIENFQENERGLDDCSFSYH